MNELKTMKDFPAKSLELSDKDLCGYSQDDVWEAAIEYHNKQLRQEAIKWIRTLQDKSDLHWKRITLPYLGNERIKEKSPLEYFTLEGLKFKDNYESSDPQGAIMILKHIFNITEDEIKGAQNGEI